MLFQAVEGMTRDSAHSLEEVKLRTEQSHKQAEQKMIAEVWQLWGVLH